MELSKKRASEVGRTLKLENAIPKAIGKLGLITQLKKQSILIYFCRKDLNEFFEYCTEWEPTTSLYFGDNVLQDVLAPKRFTSTIDSVAISEEMIAEGMHNKEALDEHPDKELMVSDFWGSYFYYPKSTTSKLTKTPSFRKLSASVTASSGPTGRSTPAGCPTTPGLRRASSMRSTEDLRKTTESNSVTVSATIEIKPTPEPVVGPMKINTLWGQLIATNARMCIPDLQFLVSFRIILLLPTKKACYFMNLFLFPF